MRNITPVRVVASTPNLVFHFHEVGQQHGLGGFAIPIAIAIPAGPATRHKQQCKSQKHDNGGGSKSHAISSKHDRIHSVLPWWWKFEITSRARENQDREMRLNTKALFLILLWAVTMGGLGCKDTGSTPPQKPPSFQTNMEPPRVIWKGNEDVTEEQSLVMERAVKKRWEQDISKGTWSDLEPCGLDVHLVFDRGDDDKLVLGAAASINCRGERDDIAVTTLGSLREGEKSTEGSLVR